MTEPPPTGTGPQYSADSRFYWNGQQWVPVPAATPPRSHGGRWMLGIVVVGVLLCGGLCTAVAIGGATSAAKPTPIPAQAGSQSGPTGSTATSPPPAACKSPCQDDDSGWIMEVANLRYDAKSGTDFVRPEAGNVFVTLEVIFTNKKSIEKNASPLDLKLKDGSGTIHDVSWKGFPNCEIWSAVKVVAGGSYGPKCTTFEAVAGKPTGLVLVWRPGGAFGGDYNIKLN